MWLNTLPESTEERLDIVQLQLIDSTMEVHFLLQQFILETNKRQIINKIKKNLYP